MTKIKNPFFKLKENIDISDFEDINKLKKICIDADKTILKLELDYKLASSIEKIQGFSEINEFMFYDNNILIGYIGISDFGGDSLEINGMVHPEHRRRGIFRRLYSLVKDEYLRRTPKDVLLLSDVNSVSGIGFIRNLNATHDHSEYEMYLKNDNHIKLLTKKVTFRKAENKDALEIAKQNAIYFDLEYNNDEIILPEQEEKAGIIIYIVELDGKPIAKVHLEMRDNLGSIYGLGVLPDYRRKGFGREILIQSIEKLKERNASNIMLQVSTNNEKALNLYRSCGFEITSCMEYYRVK